MSSEYFMIDETLGKKKKLNPFKNFFESAFTKNFVLQLTYLGLGFLSSRGTVFGGYSPFSAALIGSVPLSGIICSCTGAIIGCFFPYAVNDSIRYLSAMLAIVAIRWTLNDLVFLKGRALFAPIVSMLPLLITGFSLSFVNARIDTTVFVMYLTEALICAAAAYFFSRAFELLSSSRGISSLSQQELASVILSFCIVILSFSNINIGTVSLGRITAIVSVLFCAYFGSVSGGAISGVAAGLIFSLQSSNMVYISGSYAMGGLIAGIFSPIGKLATAASFILTNGIAALQSGNSQTVLSVAYEVFTATVLFMIIPKKYLSNLKLLFDYNISDESFSAVKNNIIMKLDFSSKTISSVSDIVESVAKKMKKINIYEPDEIYRKVADGVCKHCGIKALCWNQDYDRTMETFKGLTDALRTLGKVTVDDFPSYLSERCSKISQVAAVVNFNYDDYISRLEADRRIEEVRDIVHGQFAAMGEMLNDISLEINQFESFDVLTAKRIEAFLRDKDIPAIETVCKTDKQSHMFVEIECACEPNEKIFNKDFLKGISKICDRAMDNPLFTSSKGCGRIQLSEKAPLKACYGVKQHACDNKGLCGDSFNCFNDGTGRMIFIISDGMGSGGRAAIDGAMAAGIMSKLIKSGISFDCALRIVNSSILVKSQDESLATLDIVILDMFSGSCLFLKAGAATTFVRKGPRILRVEAPSLPVGILNEVSFSKLELCLDKDDCMLIVSDGATAFGDEWLEKELLNWSDQKEQKFASKIVKQARLRRSDNRDDDITVIAVKLKSSFSE